MNTELKAILTIIFDSIGLGEDLLVTRNIIKLIPDLVEIATDIPPVVEHAPTLLSEIENLLKGGQYSQDLITFIEQKFSLTNGDAKANSILKSALTLAQHAIEDISSLKSLIKL